MDWKTPIEDLETHGLRPYVATSESLLRVLKLASLGKAPLVYLLEREADRPFHEAYLLANALGFGDPHLKMPNWVLVDCVLMQTAVVGLAIERRRAPPALLDAFASDEDTHAGSLDYLPVSGQIAGLGLDAGTLTGFSLFSLRRFFPAAPALGILTKALALMTYGAGGKKFVGISHYDNKALSMHGRFGAPMWVEHPSIPLHPRRDMALVYAMTIDFELSKLNTSPPAGPYDFLMRADDAAAKSRIAQEAHAGRRAIIVPPFQIETENGLCLPIRMESIE